MQILERLENQGCLMEKYTSLRESATIQMKAIEHFFSMEVLITLYKEVYTFAGVFE